MEAAWRSLCRKRRRNWGAPKAELVLDFSDVERVDPSALRAIEAFAVAADEKSVKAVLRGVNVGIYKVLKLARLSSRFSIVN